MLKYVKQLITRNRPNQKKITPKLSTPNYLNRHEGETFLVLGLGPSLLEYRTKILRFIEKEKPVVMGANNVTGFIYPDYHALVNRGRFAKYSHTLDPTKSKVLLSPYFPDPFISHYYSEQYERLMFVAGDEKSFAIQDGIVMSGCGSTPGLLLGISLVMGANKIFIAGLDGYSRLLSPERKLHYYGVETQKDNTRSDEEFARRETSQARYLMEINQYMLDSQLERLKIITPTVYEEYSEDINQFL